MPETFWAVTTAIDTEVCTVEFVKNKFLMEETENHGYKKNKLQPGNQGSFPFRCHACRVVSRYGTNI